LIAEFRLAALPLNLASEQERLMKAQELAAYFAKKIAKPIPYSYVKEFHRSGSYVARHYVVEPIAVSDGVLHAMVTFKSETMGRARMSPKSALCGEVEIPIEDGDSALEVVVMAIADAEFSEQCMSFDEDDVMRLAFQELNARRADLEMKRIGIKL
jgi:hypothetical protein